MKKFRTKRILFFTGVSILAILICSFLAIYIWIDQDVRKNINIAKQKYSGTVEDALIAYLLDTTNSPRDRSQIAIWTLGQIGSPKALPILRGLYKNDPEGKTCYGRHDSVLCQYEIYKAINAEKVNWWPIHKRLNK
jgi:hypothetical protein